MTRAGLAARLFVQAALFFTLAPAQIAAGRFGWRLGGTIPVRFHRVFLALFGVRVTVTGAPPKPGTAALVVANHVSWLDIPVMGSLAPLSFVAKQEIATWPVVGLLAKLQHCVFLDRTRKAATASANAEIAARLAEGDMILLFAEGTTGDGNRLLPFRSSLVGAARAALAAASSPEQVLLQPLAIAYTRRRGLPVTRRERPQIAWYGDMELAPHVMGFVREGPLDVEVTWGVPIAFGPGTDRKHATAEAEAEVRRALRAFGSSGASRPLFSCRAGRPM